MRITLIYALPDQQFQMELQLHAGTTASSAIEHSGILRSYPAMDLAKHQIGIMGRCVTPDYVLSDGDRLEIYRPLVRDPKQARRQRAKNKCSPDPKA
ncbi:MAG: RnfH family protein [Gammaproteobacteria bacterium]|nr:RnfH family protein [Gammaproteobacteria bacterium]